jgi:hypothetical protein
MRKGLLFREEAFLYGSGSGGELSVVVGAAQVVAAVGADQLAMMAGEEVAAVGADLAMVIDSGIGGQSVFVCAGLACA